MNKIIQCPSCNTKFALNATQLAGVESPKFHCSRCNTVFSLNGDLDEITKSETKPEIKIEKKESPSLTFDQMYAQSIPSDEIDIDTAGEEIDNDPKEDDREESEGNENAYFQDTDDEDTEEESEFESTLPEDEYDDDIETEVTTKAPKKTKSEDDSPTMSFTRPSINLDTNQVPWKDSSQEKVTPKQTEIQLSYEQEDKKIDELKIDWPTDSGNGDYVVDLSHLTKNDTKTEISSSFSFTLPNTEVKKSTTEDTQETSSTKKEIDYQSRPEVKSLLASLIEDDEAAPTPSPIKHINQRFQETKNIKRDEIAREPDFIHSLQSENLTTRNDEFSLGTTSREEFVLNDKEPSNSHEYKNDAFILNSETSESIDSWTNVSTQTTKFENEKSESEQYSNELVPLSTIKPTVERLNKENRSIKDTTVLKRGEINMSLDDTSNKKYPEMDFSASSETLPSNRIKNSKGTTQESESFNFVANNSATHFLAAWSVPILLLTFMFFITSSIEPGNSSFGRSFLKTMGLSDIASDLLPPNDLTISKLNGKVITLQSGEHIVLASGNILNLSSKNYANVKVEARIFDKNQILIAKEVAFAPNLLTNSSVKSSTFDTIHNLQNTNKPEFSAIMQKTITPFSIAIDATKLDSKQEPKFYGVRIYSITNEI